MSGIRFCSTPIVLTILLVGCNDRPKMHSRSEIEDIAYDQADALNSIQSERISHLTEEITGLEARVVTLEGGLEVERVINDNLADQVSNNAKVANENVLKEATAKRRCGSKMVSTEGFIRSEPIPCTAENYFRKND